MRKPTWRVIAGLIVLAFWAAQIPPAAAAERDAGVLPTRLLGIFGGMGPEATANLYQLIVQQTPAEKDQDHIPTLMFSFPQVPDRTTCILNNDPSIIPYLVQGVQFLEKAGASLVAIPCNTAHFYHDQMQAAVKIPVLHMIRETVDEVLRLRPDVKKVGLLATSGTLRTGLYEKEFRARGVETLVPPESAQDERVMRAVAGIKAGRPKPENAALLAEPAREMTARGAEIIVLGCTEIPLAFDESCVTVPVVNATLVLARAAVRTFREIAAAAAPSPPAAAGRRGRFRDFGLKTGILPPGKWNAITDVAGVKVGQVTLIEGTDVRTGVTAILPHDGNVFQDKVPAAVHVENGFGKLSGQSQVEELGSLETPVVLTNTLSVPQAMEGLIEYTLAQPGNESVRSVNAVAGETNDGYLNDIRRRLVRPAHVLQALRSAASGPVAEGNVGAGTGTVCFGFKGGIGTSSRVLPATLGGYTVGVLVQTNYGGVLQVAGAPAGILLDRYYLKDELAESRADGSCMIVVATDAPLRARNLERLAKRAVFGLARTGSVGANGSGDYVIAFSTNLDMRIPHESGSTVLSGRELRDDEMTPLFLAAAEAAEEAVLNSLFQAETMEGSGGRKVEALPLERLLPFLK